MKKSETIGALAAALAKAQGEMKPASFNRMNPHFKNKYADLTAIWDAIRAPLSKHGLSIIQALSENEKGPIIETTLAHSSGEFVASETPLLFQQQNMQGMGSAITYARRYALSAIVGISADEDDDANASDPKPQQQIKTISKVFVAGEREREAVLKLAAARGITNEQVGNLISNKFSKDKLVQLTKDEYISLLSMLEAGAFNQ